MKELLVPRLTQEPQEHTEIINFMRISRIEVCNEKNCFNWFLADKSIMMILHSYTIRIKAILFVVKVVLCT